MLIQVACVMGRWAARKQWTFSTAAMTRASTVSKVRLCIQKTVMERDVLYRPQLPRI